MDFSGRYGRAALLAFISAALHPLVILFSGSQFLQDMLIGMVIWVIAGLLLMRQWRWFAYIAFLMCFVGIIAALGGAAAATSIAKILLFAIVLADIAVAVVLFGIIWRDPEVQQSLS